MWDIDIAKDRNGRVTVQITHMEEGPYARLSVNVETVSLKEREFVLNHDLNHPMFQGFLEEMISTGKFEDTGKTCNYGFVTNQPIWRIR